MSGEPATTALPVEMESGGVPSGPLEDDMSDEEATPGADDPVEKMMVALGFPPNTTNVHHDAVRVSVAAARKSWWWLPVCLLVGMVGGAGVGDVEVQAEHLQQTMANSESLLALYWWEEAAVLCGLDAVVRRGGGGGM